jgi:hypothetical protein
MPASASPRNSVPGSPALRSWGMRHRAPGQLGKITLPFRLAIRETLDAMACSARLLKRCTLAEAFKERTQSALCP